MSIETPSTTLENLATNLGSASELKIMSGDAYIDIKGLTKVTPNFAFDVNKTKPYVLKGDSHATKTGREITFAFEGLEVPSDPGTKTLCDYFMKLGNEGNAQFAYRFTNGDTMEFVAAVEGNFGQNEGPNSEATISGTLHVTGIPEYTVAT